ncbi:MAG: DNA polymerase III subunit epsilon [Pseudomonadota bacterium]
MREIAFDTETTGLEWQNGDRVIELGAVEMVNHVPTGETFHTLINPGRAVSEATIRITGITDEKLVDAPPFEAPEVVEALLEFIGGSPVVAHNARFDRGFLNAELDRCGRQPIEEDRWIDTVALAKTKFPGAPASLDALCRRFDISLESRSLHGALLDAQLLAQVYLELRGGRARAFDFQSASEGARAARARPAQRRPRPRPVLITDAERAAHEAFVNGMGENAVWRLVGGSS